MMTADTLYVTDLDGTLLDEQERLPARTIDILRPLIEGGLPLTVATARSWTSARAFVQTLAVRLPVVLNNGGFICDPLSGQVLHSRYYDRARAEELVALYKADGLHPLVYTLDADGNNHVYYEGIHNAAEDRYIHFRMSRGDTRFRVEGREGTWRGEHPFYVNAIGAKDELRPTARRLSARPDLYVNFSEDIYAPDFWWLEVIDSRANKGAGVRWLRERLQPRRVVCFGDQRNDIPMFAEADWGVAVANAHPEARQAADEVIGPAADSAVARYISGQVGSKVHFI